MEKKKIVFLYSEIATYFLACVEKLAQYPAIEIHIVRWPVNKEAPFQFKLPPAIKIYNRTDYTNEKLEQLLAAIQPDIIYCSGWMDKGYLKLCKQYRLKIPVIVGFDNQWKGTLKQWLAVLLSPFKIRNHFSHCWVPGEPQYKYARRLGFTKSNILTGFYSCDVDFFNSQYKAFYQQKHANFPKRFLYVGRYVGSKGVKDLWEAFKELQEEQPSEWELWCLGTGDVEPVKHPKIKHFGFVQPSELPEFVEKTGVFVLPSHFEPWGVVIHEYAAAGFPIICSDEVGARTTFVENDINGYIYTSGNKNALKGAMAAILNSTDEKLKAMAAESFKKASLITPDLWAKQLISLL
ncbi:MAG TPA: glycosyltransferase [Bacteroidia bacterium]|jgi:glycosyltransferase involved in cell wall biosynthesis|nr:glycosyltransferase [Bacteroidia bacterium]